MNYLEVLRYLINGVVCTAIHFGVLTFNINVLNFQSTGLANFIAALFGIIASFLGSKYFVFPNRNESTNKQFLKFALLYGSIAFIHGIILFVWTDMYALDYRIGFIMVTIFQITFSYLGNKYMVFKK